MKKSLSANLLFAFLVTVIMICLPLSPALCADFTGHWSGNWTSSKNGNSGGIIIDLTQAGTTLTGTYMTNKAIGDAGCGDVSNHVLTGSVSGDVASFQSDWYCFIYHEEIKYTNGVISGNTMTGEYNRYEDGNLHNWGTFTLTLTVAPTPDIKANNSDGPVTISRLSNLTIQVSLDPGGDTGFNADWWAVVKTASGWYHYDLSSRSWIPGLVVTHQGPLSNLSPFQVLNQSGLPEGTYTFFFGVDMDMNGSLDMDQIYYDSVNVTLTP